MRDDTTTHELLESIRDELVVTRTDLGSRIDKTNEHLNETNERLGETNESLEKTNERLESARTALSNRIAETNRQLIVVRTELSEKIDRTRMELSSRIDETHTLLKTEIGDRIREGFGEMRRHTAEVETRLATQLVELTSYVQDSAEATKMRRTIRDKVADHEQRLQKLEERTD